jgi:pimeloyl-ACP methyl ester carboxylesterase
VRAREPDTYGYVESGGARVYYEVFGSGPITLLFLPTWSLVHSRVWKLQVPYLARHYRVIVFDGRGNGKSGRPADASGYSIGLFADDALAVMDATATKRAVMVGYSMGGLTLATIAVNHPDRIDGAIFINPVAPFGPPPVRAQYPFGEVLPTTEGWAKHNKHYWRRDYDDWLAFFAGKLFTEPHSTKQIEDVIGWGHETDAEVLIRTYEAPPLPGEPPGKRTDSHEYYERIRCPVLVILGSEDAVLPNSMGAGVAEATGGSVATFEGGGHSPHAREPVKVNVLIRQFLETVAAGSRRSA